MRGPLPWKPELQSSPDGDKLGEQGRGLLRDRPPNDLPIPCLPSECSGNWNQSNPGSNADSHLMALWPWTTGLTSMNIGGHGSSITLILFSILRCQCNGHADTCNEQDGTGCPCQNNTETGTCQGSSPSDRRDCYKYQVRLEKQVTGQVHTHKGSEVG